VIWNIAFIPRYGLIGAATSNLAGYVVRLLLIYIVSQRLYPIPYELGRLAAMFAVALGLYFVSQLISFDSPYITTFSRTAIITIFPLVLMLVGFFHKGERACIFSALRISGRLG